MHETTFYQNIGDYSCVERRPMESSDTHLEDVWNLNYNHFSLLPATPIAQNGLIDPAYSSYYSTVSSVPSTVNTTLYPNGLSSSVQAAIAAASASSYASSTVGGDESENGYVHTTLMSAVPSSTATSASGDANSSMENSATGFNQYYQPTTSASGYYASNCQETMSGDVVCDQGNSSAFVDATIQDFNSSVWSGQGNTTSTEYENNQVAGAYGLDPYTIPIKVETYGSEEMSMAQTQSSSSSSASSTTSSSSPDNGHAAHHHLHNHTYHFPLMPVKNIQSPMKAKSEYSSSYSDCSDEDGSISRDEKRAKALDITIPISDIINLPIDEFNEKLSKYELSEVQLSLIRDIRRRGKNKVAAQNCRRRKMDQIIDLQGEVNRLCSQKKAFQLQQEQLLALRHIAREKYSRLYDFIFSAATTRPVSAFPCI